MNSFLLSNYLLRLWFRNVKTILAYLYIHIDIIILVKSQTAINRLPNLRKWLNLLATHRPRTKVSTDGVLLLNQRWPFNYTLTLVFEFRAKNEPTHACRL